MHLSLQRRTWTASRLCLKEGGAKGGVKRPFAGIMLLWTSAAAAAGDMWELPAMLPPDPE